MTFRYPGLRFLLLSITLLISTGCTTLPGKSEKVSETRPAWILQPGEGVSASAGFHVKGRQEQEDLAVSRAREEFSKRYGVKISSDHSIQQVVANDRQTAVSQKDIREEVRDNEVRATVKAKWFDPESGHLWVWLVPYPR